MEKLSALDATFIYLESEHSPMAIGGVYVIDAADAPAGYSYQSWYTLIEKRLKLSKVFRQRLVEVPLALSFPYWINDPHFDLDQHVPNVRLQAPGGMAELMQLAASTWSTTLDRERPLWDITFVSGVDSIEGISKGSFALITRVHHAAVDGRAGTDMMTAILDATPEIRNVSDEDNWMPEKLPSTLGVIGQSWSKAARKAVDLAEFVGKTTIDTVSLRTDKQLQKTEPPPRIMSAPSTVFNQPIASQRTFWGKNFEFERLRAIRKKVPGVTINDVVLAICAGGLRHYLAQRQELPGDPLVAMAPISVRGSEEGTGNQVSAMLVSLATDTGNALDRLERIRANTRTSKVHASALPANRISEFLPSETLAAAARVYTRARLGGRHRPFFNVTITNVPATPFPLYIAGARIHSMLGMAPILDGLGLILVVVSYDGKLSIGITSCEQMVPDPDTLSACFADSLAELEEAVRLADPARLASGLETVPVQSDDKVDPLKSFHDASEALENAIASLEEE